MSGRCLSRPLGRPRIDVLFYLRLTDRLHKVSPRPGRQAGQGDDRGRESDADRSWTTIGCPIRSGAPHPSARSTRTIPIRGSTTSFDKTGLYWRKMSQPDVENVIPSPTSPTAMHAARCRHAQAHLSWHAAFHRRERPRAARPGEGDPIFTYDTDTGELEQLTNDPQAYVALSCGMRRVRQRAVSLNEHPAAVSLSASSQGPGASMTSCAGRLSRRSRPLRRRAGRLPVF